MMQNEQKHSIFLEKLKKIQFDQDEQFTFKNNDLIF